MKDDAEPLAVCLAALSRQTRSPLEIIIVDNGSGDATATVARRFGATVVYESEPGIPAASSTGYDAARGDIIARLDADSVAPSTWVEGIAAALEQRPGVDAITGSAFFTDGTARWRNVGARLYLGAYFAAAGLALTHVALFGSNFAIRRSAWFAVRDSVHTTGQGIHDDFDLSFHLGRRHRIRYFRKIRLGISSRPLTDGHGAIRIHRGFHTVTLHWPQELPWLRLTRRLWYRTGTHRRREKLGSTLGADNHAIKKDFENFKEYIEKQGTEDGSWRGDVDA